MRRTFFVLILLVASRAIAQSPASAPSSKEIDNKSYWICKSKKKVRTIRVHIKDDGVCETVYSREGEEKVVGSGKNHDSCINFLNNIKTNLEKSNWTCRDITDTKITASID